MYFHFANVLIFLGVGALFVLVALFLSRLIRPHKPSPTKYTTYECGEIPFGGSWIQFNLRFYVIALIFLIFEVEVIFMYPWAVVLKRIGVYAFVEMAIFIVILLVGLAYVWRKGDLDWVLVPGVELSEPAHRRPAKRPEPVASGVFSLHESSEHAAL